MRTRRQLIKVGGTAAAVGIAGCLEEVPEEDDDEPVDDEPEEEEDDEEVDDDVEQEEEEEEEEEEDEEETEEAVFEVVSMEGPSEVKIGIDFTWTVEVENTGDSDGVFETTVQRSRGGGPSEEIDAVSIEVDAGETETGTYSGVIDLVGSYRYGLGDTEAGFSVTANERDIGFGETYVNPDEVSMTVDGVERFYDVRLVSSYTYTDEDGRRIIERASEGREFALVSVESSKEGRALVDLPRREEFVLFVDGEAYDSVERLRDDEYEGGETRSRSRTGVVMFEVDDDVSRTDTFEVYWSREYEGGEAEVTWST